MSKIKEVKAKDNFCLDVELDNGSSIILNLESRLQTVRFGLLEDKEFFKTVTTDGNFIRWGDQIEISVNEVFLVGTKITNSKRRRKIRMEKNEKNRKKQIRSFMAIIISICMVISTVQITHAASAKLSEIPAGTVITIGGHDWNVLNPATGYLMSREAVGAARDFDSDNTNLYNPADTNNIAYYLNNTFYNSLTAEGKAMILDHAWGIGVAGSEGTPTVSCKVGLISYAEFNDSVLFAGPTWTRTPFSSTEVRQVQTDTTILHVDAAGSLGRVVPMIYISPNTVITDNMRNHTVTVSVNNSSIGAASGGGSYAEGENVTVTANAFGGEFINWTVNGSEVSTSATYTFQNGASDIALVANFGPKKYNVTVTTPYAEYGSASGGGRYNNGSNFTITATPNPGYLFYMWYCEDSSGMKWSETIGASKTFKIDYMDYNFTAFFQMDPNAKNVNLSCDPSGGGTVAGGGIKTSGASITVTATANEGYRFVGWEQSDSTVSTSAAYSFTVPSSDISLNAKFELIPFKITTSNPSAGERNKAYSHSFTVEGGVGTKTYEVTDGALPAGLTLSAVGVVSGTPTAIGSSTFTVKVTESGALARSDSKEYTMTINEEAVVIDKTNPPNGSVGAAYNHSFTATGGTGTKTFAVTSGALPAGLTLAPDGTLSGTPTTIGTSNFTVKASDSATPAVTDSNACSITIAPETLVINKANPASVIAGTPYSHSFTATGGTGTKTYAVTSGTLPAGLTLAADGTLSGTPSAIGTKTFTVTVADSATPTVTDSNEYTMEIKAPLTIDTSNPASGTVGTPYMYSFTATGGTGARSFAATSGTLPGGLSLATDGTLSGTPTAIEAKTFTVTATDSASPAVSVSNAYTVTINPAALVVNTSNPASGTVGTAYSHSFTATGGTGAKTFTVTAGTLPAGLSLAADGTLSGTPSAIETKTFTVTAADSATPSVTDSSVFTMNINPAALLIGTSNPAGGKVGIAYSHSFTATGGTGAKTFAVTAGTLPAGLSLSTGGTLSGTPSAIGTSTVTVTVTDSATPAVTVSSIYTVSINAISTNNGGSGSGGAAEKEKTTTEKDLKNSSPSVTSTTTTEAKSDADGKAAASVTESQIKDAVDKAITAAATNGAGTAAKVEIKVAAQANANSVETSIPKAAVNEITKKETDALTVSTPIASLTFDEKSLATISKEATADVKITASKVDVATLSQEASQAVGDRPVFNFSVTSGDETISRFNGNVTVAVPYTPKADENADAIVIYYINAKGELETVKNCAYDPTTGMVSFKTNHFSQYAVGYNDVSFKDVPENAWYEKAVTFVAARGITTGTGNNNYSPNSKLTRGQFLVMVMRAYGIEAEENASDNFADAGNTYYTEYLAAAKRLGITDGIGSNKFAPEKAITRQEMFTLLYNTLIQIGELPIGDSGKELTAYSDGSKVEPWAADAVTYLVKAGSITGNNGKLQLTDTTTRAQMTQVIYNLLSK